MINYPKLGDHIIFREPIYRTEVHDGQTKFYIQASVNGNPVKEIIVSAMKQKMVMRGLLLSDGKLLAAEVLVTNEGFKVLKHSPQLDFLNKID